MQLSNEDQLLYWYNRLNQRQDLLVRMQECRAPEVVINKQHELIAQALQRVKEVEFLTNSSHVA